MRSNRFRNLASWLLLACLAGCGKAQPDAGGLGGYDHAGYAAGEASEAALATSDATGDDPAGAAVPTPAERKIIYTAEVSVIVEDFGGIPRQVKELVDRHRGYVARSDLRSSSGRPRSGTWTIRVPVGEYGTFLEAASGLGELQYVREDTQEVTAEYYDVEARIRNKQREEERLLELLDTQAGKLPDVLSVEKELSRVREEIERYQGRMRVLQDQTTLSTITLRIDELRGYAPSETPGFRTRIARAWNGSLEALRDVAQNLVIAAAALAPWLAVLLVFALVPLLILRRLLRRGRRRAAATQEVVEASLRDR